MLHPRTSRIIQNLFFLPGPYRLELLYHSRLWKDALPYSPRISPPALTSQARSLSMDIL